MYSYRIAKLISPINHQHIHVELSGEATELKELLSHLFHIKEANLKGLKDSDGVYYTFSGILRKKIIDIRPYVIVIKGVKANKITSTETNTVHRRKKLRFDMAAMLLYDLQVESKSFLIVKNKYQTQGNMIQHYKKLLFNDSIDINREAYEMLALVNDSRLMKIFKAFTHNHHDLTKLRHDIRNLLNPNPNPNSSSNSITTEEHTQFTTCATSSPHSATSSLASFIKVINHMSFTDQSRRDILHLLSNKNERMIEVFEDFQRNKMALTKSVLMKIIASVNMKDINKKNSKRRVKNS